jgi:AraC-like DNA-binding protein
MRRILVVTKNPGLRTFLRVTFESRLTIDATPATSEAVSWILETPAEVAIFDVLALDRNLSRVLSIHRTRLPECWAIVLTEDLDERTLDCLAAPPSVKTLWSRPSELCQLALQVDTLLYGEPPRTVTLAVNRAVERLVTHMSEHYSEHLRLQDLASVIGLSRNHLAHVFHAAVGTGVMRFLTMIRVEAAKDLLTHTNAKLDSLAESVGFCDSAHFSRVFHRLTGCRPGQYRRRSLGTARTGLQSVSRHPSCTRQTRQTDPTPRTYIFSAAPFIDGSASLTAGCPRSDGELLAGSGS